MMMSCGDCSHSQTPNVRSPAGRFWLCPSRCVVFGVHNCLYMVCTTGSGVSRQHLDSTRQDCRHEFGTANETGGLRRHERPGVTLKLACSAMPQQMCCHATDGFMLLQAPKRVESLTT